MAAQSTASLEALLTTLTVDAPVPSFPGSDVLHKPSDVHRAYLADITSKSLGCSASLAYEAVQVVPAANARDNSDLDLVLPKLKLKSANPKQIASEVAPKFDSHPLFLRPLADGVHLRFFFSHTTLPQLVLHYVDSQGDAYGTNSTLARTDPATPETGSSKVLIDFSRPKLASEFNAAHLRSSIVGAQVANLYQSRGWNVVRLNYLGDWGKDLGLLAVGWGRFGSEEAFQQDPMGHVLEVYDKIKELFQPEWDASKTARDEGKDTAEIEGQGLFAERDAFFKRMEGGDPEAIALWRRIRNVSIDYYVKAYGRLGIKFDEYSGESQVSPESIAEVETVLKEKGFYEESDGSWIIDFNKHGHKLGVAVIRSRIGSTTYILRDIAAVLDRAKKYDFGKMIYVVDGSQDSHFSKVFQALRYMGRDDLANRLEHISLGKVNGMLPQLGRVQLLGDIVDQSNNTVRDVLGAEQEHPADIQNTDAAAAILGATGLIAQDSLNKRNAAYTFSAEKLASFESGTGLGLQAAFARLHAKITTSGHENATLANVNYAHLQDELCMEVLRLMIQYPEVTVAAFKAHEPSLIMTYLLRLADEVEYLYDEDGEDDDEAGGQEENIEKSADKEVPGETPAAKEPDESAPPEAILAKAVLFKHVRQILANGMRLLGITPVVG
ncbi:arginyl-tRNA synthetase [Microdochium bolleyi]|uniref:arginine--tRNA ligase n=1 Tax=Microdochium bolleyi TaxID=196109 RepID=A0A136IYT6_9PEZI|nr:arginyl-tRNA synthetase [Microdochium bolleyi]